MIKRKPKDIKKKCPKSETAKSEILRGITKLDIHILKELYHNEEGLRVKLLLRLLSTTRATLYRHLRKLEIMGLLQNIFPVWKLDRSQGLSKKWDCLLRCDNIQSHRFSFVLKLIRKPSWWDRRQNKLMKLKDFQFKKVEWSNTMYAQMARDDFIIQAFPNTIVFINKRHYHGSSVYDCLIESIEDTLQMIQFLEQLWNIKLALDGIPHMSIKSHEYVELDHVLSQKCKKDKKGFLVEINNQRRVWVDFSIPFGLEYGHRDHAVDDYKKLYPFFQDLLKQDESIILSEVVKEQEELKKLLTYMMHQEPEVLDPKDNYFG